MDEPFAAPARPPRPGRHGPADMALVATKNCRRGGLLTCHTVFVEEWHSISTWTIPEAAHLHGACIVLFFFRSEN